MSRSWTISIDAPAKWLNANDRDKRRPDKVIAAWRDAAAVLARKGKLPKLGACRIIATLHFTNNIRRDAPNYYPTIKACVDGLVIGEVLDDDDDLHVTELTIRRGEKIPAPKYGLPGRLVLTVVEVLP